MEVMGMAGEWTRRSGARAEAPLPIVRRHRDTDWPERIAKAKEARAAAREARKGKPATFATRQVPQWTGQ